MQLISIRLKNIGSHKDTYYEFKDIESIYLLLGTNGAGKSTFIGSIPLALFGDDPYYGNVYDLVRLGSEAEGSELEINFKLSGNLYRILRKIKVNKTSKSSEAYLYMGETLLAGPKVKEFDLAIENLLSSKKVFLSSVFTSQNIAGDITEMPISERTELLNKLWDLTFLQDISDKAKTKIKELQLGVDKSKSDYDRISLIIAPEQQYKDSLVTSKSMIDFFITKKQEISSQIKELQKNILEIDTIDQKKKEYNELLSQYNTIRSKIVTNTAEKSSNELKLTNEVPFSQEFSTLIGLDELLLKLENNKEELSKLTSEKTDLSNKLANTMSLLTSISKDIVEVPCQESTCPYFTQMDERKSKKVVLENEITTLKSKIEENNNKFSTIEYNTTPVLQEQINLVKTKISRYNYLKTELNSLSFIKDNLNKNIQQLLELEKDNETLSVKLSTLDALIKELVSNTDTSFKDKIKELENSLITVERNYADALKDEGKYTSLLEDIDNKKIELIAIEDKLEVDKKEIKYYTIIKDDFSKKGIQSMVLNKLKGELEKVINDLLGTLNNNKFSIKLSTKKELASGEEKESLEILVSDKPGWERDISRYSGGEKKLLKLIIRLSLSIYQAMKNKVKYGIFVLDECTDTLDSEKRLEMVEIIKGLNKYFNQILIVSHSEELQGHFSNKIEFVKDEYTKII